jgi:hypothetical protein
MKTWIIKNAKTGEELARVERFYKNVGTLANPSWRVWYQLVGNPDINADTRSIIASYISGCVGAKTKMVEVK